MRGGSRWFPPFLLLFLLLSQKKSSSPCFWPLSLDPSSTSATLGEASSPSSPTSPTWSASNPLMRFLFLYSFFSWEVSLRSWRSLEAPRRTASGSAESSRASLLPSSVPFSLDSSSSSTITSIACRMEQSWSPWPISLESPTSRSPTSSREWLSIAH